MSRRPHQYVDDYPPARAERPRERVRDSREPPVESNRHRRDERMDTRMDTRMDDRMEDRMDNRMDISRMDNRMDIPRMDNRMDSRGDRGIDPRVDSRMEIPMDIGEPPVTYREYRDPHSGEIYREPVLIRNPAPVYEDRRERDERMPLDRERDRNRRDRGDRQVIDMFDEPRDRPAQPGRDREFFLIGDGISREVIQFEISRYLGQDATVRPGTHDDGRKGFFIRAYRAPTSAMVKSLREDSARWEQEREKKARRGQPQGTYGQSSAAGHSQQERSYPGRQYDDDEMMDAPPLPRAERRYERDEPRDARDGRDVRDTRPPQSSRHAPTSVTSGYPPEPSYAAYAVGPQGFDPQSQPRTTYGGSTPPLTSSTRGPPNFIPPGFAPQAQPPPGVFLDSRGRPVVTSASSTYPSNTVYAEARADRHRR